MSSLHAEIEQALGCAPRSSRALGGGCIGEVYALELADGARVVAKVDRGSKPKLDIEGYMLRYLAEHSALPVPAVFHCAPGLLIMEHMDGDSHFTRDAERHAAELLAALHTVRGPQFGLERDTLIGGLHQPNAWSASWVGFFREHRLLHFGEAARRAGLLSKRVFDRLETFTERLGEFIEEPAYPSLLHGDVWTTNVLARGGKITGFIDPAVYYGDPEIELAFTTLFGTFGAAFFERYEQLRPLRPGFHEQRRGLYNLYPLLVHTCLFGGGYAHSVEQNLSALGF